MIATVGQENLAGDVMTTGQEHDRHLRHILSAAGPDELVQLPCSFHQAMGLAIDGGRLEAGEP